jgi:glyoxylase-like metal-dependent hydrolase (beta-lactamase superfamily II)
VPVRGAPQSSGRELPGQLSFPAASATPRRTRSFASLIDDVEQRLFGTLPDETWVYPGHGKDTTRGAERPQLGEWRARGW